MWFAAFSINKYDLTLLLFCYTFDEGKLQGYFIMIEGDIWYNFRVVESDKFHLVELNKS